MASVCSNRLVNRPKRATLLTGLLCAVVGCMGGARGSHYRPQSRAVTLTAVPLLTRELATTYPFLAADFRKGGVLEGKEVYAFVPDHVTAFEGDTLRFTLINPEDDQHTFVLSNLAVTMPPQTTVNSTYVAREAGIFHFVCDIPAHKPMMYGELVVLKPQ